MDAKPTLKNQILKNLSFLIPAQQVVLASLPDVIRMRGVRDWEVCLPRCRGIQNHKVMNTCTNCLRSIGAVCDMPFVRKAKTMAYKCGMCVNQKLPPFTKKFEFGEAIRQRFTDLSKTSVFYTPNIDQPAQQIPDDAAMPTTSAAAAKKGKTTPKKGPTTPKKTAQKKVTPKKAAKSKAPKGPKQRKVRGFEMVSPVPFDWDSTHIDVQTVHNNVPQATIELIENALEQYESIAEAITFLQALYKT